MSEAFAIVRALIKSLFRLPPEFFAPRRGCGVPWWVSVIVTFLTFAVVVVAMVVMTVHGVPLGAAVAVITACAALTAWVVSRIFGSGPDSDPGPA